MTLGLGLSNSGLGNQSSSSRRRGGNKNPGSQRLLRSVSHLNLGSKDFTDGNSPGSNDPITPRAQGGMEGKVAANIKKFDGLNSGDGKQKPERKEFGIGSISLSSAFLEDETGQVFKMRKLFDSDSDSGVTDDELSDSDSDSNLVLNTSLLRSKSVGDISGLIPGHKKKSSTSTTPPRRSRVSYPISGIDVTGSDPLTLKKQNPDTYIKGSFSDNEDDPNKLPPIPSSHVSSDVFPPTPSEVSMPPNKSLQASLFVTLMRSRLDPNSDKASPPPPTPPSSSSSKRSRVGALNFTNLLKKSSHEPKSLELSSFPNSRTSPEGLNVGVARRLSYSSMPSSPLLNISDLSEGTDGVVNPDDIHLFFQDDTNSNSPSPLGLECGVRADGVCTTENELNLYSNQTETSVSSPTTDIETIQVELNKLLDNPKDNFELFKTFVDTVNDTQQEKQFLNDFLFMYDPEHQDQVERLNDLGNLSNDKKTFSEVLKRFNSGNDVIKSELYDQLIVRACLPFSSKEPVNFNGFKKVYLELSKQVQLSEDLEKRLQRAFDNLMKARASDSLTSFVSNEQNTRALNYIVNLSTLKDVNNAALFLIYNDIFGTTNKLTEKVFNEVLTSCRKEVAFRSSSKDSSENFVKENDLTFQYQQTSGAGNSCGLHAVYGEDKNGLITLEVHENKRKLLSGFVKKLYTDKPRSLFNKVIDENLYEYALESYSGYEDIYSRLVDSNILDLDTSFSQLGELRQRYLPFWSEALFDFVKVYFKQSAQLDTRINEFQTEFKDKIHGELKLCTDDERKDLLNSFLSSNTGDLEWDVSSLGKLTSENALRGDVKVAAVKLKTEQEMKTSKFDKVLVEFYLNTVFEKQVCQENYPLTNSELALMFLADSDKKDQKLKIYSAQQQRFVQYKKSTTKEDAETTYVHHRGFHYSRLLPQTQV